MAQPTSIPFRSFASLTATCHNRHSDNHSDIVTRGLIVAHVCSQFASNAIKKLGDSSSPLKIVDVGAGTGAASDGILRAIDAIVPRASRRLRCLASLDVVKSGRPFVMQLCEKDPNLSIECHCVEPNDLAAMASHASVKDAEIVVLGFALADAARAIAAAAGAAPGPVREAAAHSEAQKFFAAPLRNAAPNALIFIAETTDTGAGFLPLSGARQLYKGRISITAEGCNDARAGFVRLLYADASVEVRARFSQCS